MDLAAGLLSVPQTRMMVTDSGRPTVPGLPAADLFSTLLRQQAQGSETALVPEESNAHTAAQPAARFDAGRFVRGTVADPIEAQSPAPTGSDPVAQFPVRSDAEFTGGMRAGRGIDQPSSDAATVGPLAMANLPEFGPAGQPGATPTRDHPGETQSEKIAHSVLNAVAQSAMTTTEATPPVAVDGPRTQGRSEDTATLPGVNPSDRSAGPVRGSGRTEATAGKDRNSSEGHAEAGSANASLPRQESAGDAHILPSLSGAGRASSHGQPALPSVMIQPAESAAKVGKAVGEQKAAAPGATAFQKKSAINREPQTASPATPGALSDQREPLAADVPSAQAAVVRVAASESAPDNPGASSSRRQTAMAHGFNRPADETRPMISKAAGTLENKMDETPPPDARTTSVQARMTAGHAAGLTDKTILHTYLHDPGAVSPVTAPSSPEVEGLSPGAAHVGPAIPATSAPMTAALGAPTAHSTPISPSAALERMDAAAAPQVMESTPQRLAVGVHNAGLGWVEIRTSSTAGQVSATLSTGSAESHSALAAQLPAVREYLAGEQIHVDYLAAERFSQSAGDQGGSSRDPSRNEGARQETTVQQQSSPGASSADVDAEGLSYINVRV